MEVAQLVRWLVKWYSGEMRVAQTKIVTVAVMNVGYALETKMSLH